ncbi:MAG: hypothetical protein WCZ18_08420 [Ottowia sp.]|nr:hypothetical protein [Ottowia sp.]
MLADQVAACNQAGAMQEQQALNALQSLRQLAYNKELTASLRLRHVSSCIHA